jgi:hypothetical protein
MNNKIAIGLATFIIILNGFIGHFFAPNGIFLTPIVLIITTLFVAFGTKNLNVIIISILTYFFVALNDISIKLYSGGTHDNEGLCFVHLFLFFGLIPTFGILFVGIFKQNEEKLVNKIIALVLFVILIAIHLQIFSNLGLE